MKEIKAFTKNKELYQKLNLLNFFNDVVLTNTTSQQAKRIINNINARGGSLKIIEGDKYIIIKKLSAFDLRIYRR